MCSVQLKHVSTVGWGLGVFGPGSIYFSFPEEALSLSLALRLSESAWDEGSVARPLLT